MKVLVTGGAGYIGSHVVAQLFRDGHEAVVIDDFSNSERSYVAKINQAVGRDVPLLEGDFANTALLKKTLNEQGPIDGVIHIAAFKYVSESVEQPLKYFRNNVSGFVELVDVMSQENIPIIFSSSAAVYGEPPTDKITEDETLRPLNAYGMSKLMDEQILEAACGANTAARGIALRYFNVVGADSSGLLGEHLTENSRNLWPVVVEAATGKIPHVPVFGGDFDTPDKTGLRDYVHVADLADSHIRTLEFLAVKKPGYYNIFNVGTGVPTSVLEFIKTFESVSGQEIKHELVGRRPGDAASSYAVCDRINQELGWHSQLTIEDALRDAWAFQQKLS